MDSYALTCPWCKEVIDSQSSAADTLDFYREHLKEKHPEKPRP